MVDRTFSEWDKASMLIHLQQPDVRLQTAGCKAGLAVRSIALKANSALLLALVLIIIPTYSGVALIT